MFDITTLQSNLEGYIGFRGATDASVPSIDSTLTASDSGMYWDDFSGYLYTDVLFSTAPNFPSENYLTFSATATYDVADKVIYLGNAWRSKVSANASHTPAAGSYWESMFSVFLGDKVNASIAKLFNRLATEKKINSSTKAIFENKKLFLGSGDMSNLITATSRFVGVAIRPKNIDNIRIKVTHVGLQFTQAQTDLPIYLFNSQSKSYVARQLVSTTAAYNFAWVALTGFNLDFVNILDDVDSGSTWYIGYFEDDITGSAIFKPYSWNEGPCKGCPGSLDEYTLWNLWSKYYTAHPISFATLDGTNLPSEISWDMLNWGLNFAFTVVPDVTDAILANKQALTYPLGLQFACDMLQWIATNPPRRTNPVQGNIQAGAVLYDLNGEDGKGGLKKELTDAIKGLSFDFSELSAALPSARPSGFKYRAI